MIRGIVPVYLAQDGLAGTTWPLVHTTDLRDGELVGVTMRLKALQRSINGPAVLLPRVGQPNVKKVVVYLNQRRIVLSDCVVGLKCASERDARELHARVVSSWKSLEQHYGGTCAPYLTMVRLAEYLTTRGVRVSSEQTV